MFHPARPSLRVAIPFGRHFQRTRRLSRRNTRISVYMNTDRNLLFGILALQMDFVSRDDLIAAMNAWVLNKSKALGQLLLERKAIGAEEQALLDGLVKKHMQRHGNDAAKSLAAIQSVQAVQAELHKISDVEVQASLQ